MATKKNDVDVYRIKYRKIKAVERKERLKTIGTVACLGGFAALKLKAFFDSKKNKQVVPAEFYLQSHEETLETLKNKIFFDNDAVVVQWWTDPNELARFKISRESLEEGKHVEEFNMLPRVLRIGMYDVGPLAFSIELQTGLHLRDVAYFLFGIVKKHDKKVIWVEKSNDPDESLSQILDELGVTFLKVDAKSVLDGTLLPNSVFHKGTDWEEEYIKIGKEKYEDN